MTGRSVQWHAHEQKIVLTILHEFIPHAHVWVFGSRATGSARKYSDLDLAIQAHESLSLSQQAELSDAFAESALPYKVDVVDWTSISDDFRRLIAADRIEIQASE